MTREDLNKKQAELNPYHMSQENALHVGHNVGWNACADILLPEIDNGVIKYQNQYQYSKFFHSKAIQQTSKITQLEKENAELKDKFDHVFIHLLERQLEIATMALEHYQEIESRTFSKLAVATNALALIAEVVK